MKRFRLTRMFWGFGKSLLEKYTPLELSKPELESIYNYLLIDEGLSTSGQPTEAQFRAIAEAGFDRVINLLPADVENALANEPELVRSLGMAYDAVPVNFRGPKESDYQRFAEIMASSENEKRWVHCAANARVSAFIYRYRRNERNEDEALCKTDLDKIWSPVGVWKRLAEI